MPYRADPQCPECRVHRVVFVTQQSMPVFDDRYEYDYPCGETINGALKVFEEVAEIPPGAVIAVPE